MELEIENTEVVSANNIQIEAPGSVEVIEGEKDYEVSVVKKEYTIIGDSIFIPSMYEDAPPWLKEFIDTTLNVAVTNRDQSLIDRLQSMLSLLDYVPKNQYTEQINQIVSEDGILNSRIATLNSNFTDSINTTNATIAEINLTYASKNEAAAIASNMLSASLSGSGQIGSTLIQLQEAYADLESTTAQSVNALESVMEGEINGNARAMETIRTYVGIDEAGASTHTGLSAYLESSDGTIGGADSQLANDIRVTAEGVESKFAYNSIVNINGIYKKSGFGLTTNYTSGNGTQANPYVSEFWIDASRLKFTNSNQTGRTAPFTIDATGVTPRITFNGVVAFSNVTGSENLALKDMSNVTTIDGGKITTGSISAARIDTAGLIAENISADTIYGKKIVGAIIEGAVIKASFLDLNQGLKLLTSYVISASTYLANMNNYPDCIYESDTNTYRIPTLTRVNENTNSKVLSAGQALEGALSPYNAAKEGNLLKARLIRPTFETTGSFRMVTASNAASGYDSPSSINFSINLGPTEVFRFQYSRAYANNPTWFHEFTVVNPYYGNSTIRLDYSIPVSTTKVNPAVYSTSVDVLTPLVKVRLNVTYNLWWKAQTLGHGDVVYDIYQTQTIVTLDTLAFRNKIPFDWVSGHIAIVNNNSGSVTAALNSHLFIDNTQA